MPELKKYKIGVIGLKGLPAFGGAAAVGENIINQLKHRFDFTVYSVNSHTTYKTGTLNGFKHIVLKKISNKRLNTLWYYIKSSLHAVFKADYDMIHLHHRDAAFIMLLLKFKYKILLTPHGVFPKGYNGYLEDDWQKFTIYFKLQEYLFMRLADQISCVSSNGPDLIKEKTGKNAVYIPNGIDVNILSKEKKTKDDYLFFAANRILKSKGLTTLIHALRKSDFKDKLIIAGDLEKSENYKEEVLNLSENLNIEFVGLIKEKKVLQNYCLNAKLFIFPSIAETMSMMLLEVVSQKTPIIASDIEGNRNIFSEEELLYFKVDDSDDLAEKIIWALENYDQMIIRADKAYTKLIKNYTWQKSAQQYANLYEKILMNNSSFKKGKLVESIN